MSLLLAKAKQRGRWLNQLKRYLTLRQRRTLYKTFIQSLLNYSIPIVGPFLGFRNKRKLDAFINNTVKQIGGLPKTGPPDLLKAELQILATQDLLAYHQLRIIKRRKSTEDKQACRTLTRLRLLYEKRQQHPIAQHIFNRLRRSLPKRLQNLCNGSTPLTFVFHGGN
jgi:hypothetical protein